MRISTLNNLDPACVFNLIGTGLSSSFLNHFNPNSLWDYYFLKSSLKTFNFPTLAKAINGPESETTIIATSPGF
ncbi:hypothetical protein ADU37_CDS21700 [Thermococcus sp. 2319x1]|nr:hypothetical protein ADU37_CDS21700 [Thermococcus sp. 2319x1]